MDLKVGIVTTIKGCKKNILKFFTDYHFAIGFGHIFMFYDDLNEVPPTEILENSNITVIKNDEHLKELWSKTQSSSLLNYINTDLIARQILNVEVAIQLALKLKISWILHIDVDEIFLSRNWTDIKDHFRLLEKYNIHSITYTNYEAIPEKMNIRNYFKEVTLFKKHKLHLNDDQLKLLKEKIYNYSSDYFLFYSNGKSAAKVTDSLKPVSPHKFSNSRIFPSVDLPIILHYPICGFSNFYNKYTILGKFPDKWLGNHNISDLFPFHIKARNTVIYQTLQEAKAFYRSNVIVKDQMLIKLFMENEIFCRIMDVSLFFKS